MFGKRVVIDAAYVSKSVSIFSKNNGGTGSTNILLVLLLILGIDANDDEDDVDVDDDDNKGSLLMDCCRSKTSSNIFRYFSE